MRHFSLPLKDAILLLIACFAILGIILGGVQYSGKLDASRLVKNVGIVKSLILVCRTYASEYEGKFPVSLDALYPDYVDTRELFSYDDGQVEPAKFLYFAGDSIIMIVSPHPSKGKRIVGFSDGHVDLICEEEYQVMISP